MTLIPRFTSSLFVGRKRELTLLQTAWQEAQAGQGRLVLLVGGPGIGKTRTTSQFAEQGRRRLERLPKPSRRTPAKLIPKRSAMIWSAPRAADLSTSVSPRRLPS